MSGTNNNLIFSGTVQQTSKNDLTGLAQGSITFANGGFDLTGNKLTLSPSGNYMVTNLAGTNVLAMPINLPLVSKRWVIAANSELQLTGVMTNSHANTSIAGWLFLTNGGTVRILGNMQGYCGMDLLDGTVIVDGGFVDQFNDGVRFNVPAGKTVTAILTNNGYWRMGTAANFRLGIGASGSMNQMFLQSGTLELYGGTSGNGRVDISSVSGATSVFNQNGGTVWGSAAGNGVVINIATVAGADGTYNLNGGLLWAGQIKRGNASAANAVFNFNGGTLKPWVSSTTFMQGLLTANVQSGGAIIDTTNLNITIAQPLLAAGGGLTKLGSGTLTLTGVNSYDGDTVVNNGTLVTSAGSFAGGGGLTVANDASVYLSNSSGGLILMSSLNFGSSLTNSITLDLGSSPFPNGNAVIYATSLSASGTAVINIAGANFTPGVYPLIQYSSASGLEAIKLGSLPPGVSATLLETAGGVSLNVTGAPKNIAWSAAVNTAWDTATANWRDLANGNQTNFAQFDNVNFDDSAPSAEVTITGTVTPTTVTLTGGYVFSFTGTGKISGNATVSAASSGLTMGTANDYAGGTLLQNSALYIANNQALGSGPLQLTGAFAELASSGTTDWTITNSVVLSTNLWNLMFGDPLNPGALTLNGPFNFGNAPVMARTMTVDNDLILGGPITTSGGGISTLTGGGRLIIRGQGQIGVSGTTVTHNGANVIIDGGTLKTGDGWRMNALAGVNLFVIVTNGGSFIMTNTSTANFRIGNAGGDTTSSTNTLDVDGTMIIAGASGSGGVLMGGSGTLDVLNLRSAGLLICNHVSPGAQPTLVNFYGGTLRASIGNANFMQGLTNAYIFDGLTVDTTNVSITIAQPLLAGGAGGVTKIGSGTLTLNGLETYTGSTIISNGTLVLGPAASLATSPLIAMAAGTTLNVSNVAPWTVDAGQTLSGPGTVLGRVQVNGTVTLGTAVGTLAFSNDLALAGTTVLKLNKDSGLTNDTIVVNGALTYGGNLNVVLAGGTPLAVNDSFKLFKFAAAPTGNFVINLPPVPMGGKWDTSQLSTSGIITVVSTNAAPPQITSVSTAGGSIVFSGTNGTSGAGYVVLTSTNLTLPLANWTPLVTNQFGGNGTFNVTNTVDSSKPQLFYIIKLQ